MTDDNDKIFSAVEIKRLDTELEQMVAELPELERQLDAELQEINTSVDEAEMQKLAEISANDLETVFPDGDDIDLTIPGMDTDIDLDLD